MSREKRVAKRRDDSKKKIPTMAPLAQNQHMLKQDLDKTSYNLFTLSEPELV